MSISIYNLYVHKITEVNSAYAAGKSHPDPDRANFLFVLRRYVFSVSEGNLPPPPFHTGCLVRYFEQRSSLALIAWAHLTMRSVVISVSMISIFDNFLKVQNENYKN